MNRTTKLPIFIKKAILSGLIVVFAFSGIPIFAATSTLDISGDPGVLVCDVLASIGLGCGSPPPTVVDNSSNSDTNGTQQNQDNSSQTNSAGNLQASIANVTVQRTASGDEVILVKVPATNGVKSTLGLNTNDAIFEIIRGQKHFIPTVDIFFDYGFDLSAVQSITHEDLEPFPRAKLVNVYKDNKKKYYITEGHMIRLIPNKRVFESYGDREEDMIAISKKEFNFYPRNQYVFLENPLTMDVFQIVDDGTKRYVVPQVLKKLRIQQDWIAPVNQVQFDGYVYGAPIIF